MAAARSESYPSHLLIWAQDARFLAEASSQWLGQWSPDGSYVTLAAGGLEPNRLHMELNTLPMWSERQIVRLWQAEAASKDLVGILEKYMENPNPTTSLLVEFVGDLNPKSREFPTIWRKTAEIIEQRPCQPRNAKDFITRRLNSEGFSIAREAVDSLVEWASVDFGKLASALEILCLYKREEKRIEANDLDDLLGTGGTPDLWAMQDALMANDKNKMLGTIQRISEDPQAEPLILVGMLAKQLRSILLLHGHEARGKRRQDVTPKELGFFHPFPAQKVRDSADRWPAARVRAALGVLSDLDVALKSHHSQKNPNINNRWVLTERHLLKIVSPGKRKPAGTGSARG